MRDRVRNESPYSKQTVTLMNQAQVSSRLREVEESYFVERSNGVLRYDVSQLPSNNPIEDDHAERIVTVPLVTPEDQEYSTDWLFWGIFDGHGGWSTSAKLREALIPYVTRELNHAYRPVTENAVRRLAPEEDEIDDAITRAFVKLDDDIVNKAAERLLAHPTKQAAIEAIPPALSGSCALLAFYDSASHYLRVALTGDSRAVLGEQQVNGEWTARALTTDQTGSNEAEVYRIRAEHPGENEFSIRRGRVLGIYEPSRAFGDANMKWPRDIQMTLGRQFFGRTVPQYLRTPPYLTAKPVITRTKIDPERPSFLVIASDGLYELLSNEQVVKLVLEWVNKKRPESLKPIWPKKQESATWVPSWLSRNSPTRPRSDSAVEDISENKEAQKLPIRQRRAPNDVVVKDENAATHLVRNALGGADQEQVSMLVSIPSPMSRRYRDDLTVTVVFFGQNGQDTGKVRVNFDATHTQVKPKL